MAYLMIWIGDPLLNRSTDLNQKQLFNIWYIKNVLPQHESNRNRARHLKQLLKSLKTTIVLLFIVGLENDAALFSLNPWNSQNFYDFYNFMKSIIFLCFVLFRCSAVPITFRLKSASVYALFISWYKLQV